MHTPRHANSTHTALTHTHAHTQTHTYIKKAITECVIAVIDLEIFKYFHGEADTLTDTVTRNVAFSLLDSLSSSVPLLS